MNEKKIIPNKKYEISHICKIQFLAQCRQEKSAWIVPVNILQYF